MRVDKVAPEQVDPEFAAMLGAIPDFTLSAELVGALQAGTSPGTAVSTDTVARDDRAIGEGVVVRVHAPRDAAMPRPAVVSIHGGGYVLGSREMDDPQLERWARELGVVGVSVEYRLAPDTQYPGPLDDCFEAYCWLHEQADDLGVDAGRIGVAGVSAGGGLAAALTLLARERGASMPAFQLLEAPMIDDRQCTPSSRLEGLAIWNRESNEFGWRSYLGDRYGRPDVPAFAAPAAGGRPRRTSADLCECRFHRRLPRRGCGVRDPAEPGRRPDRAARVSGCAARVPTVRRCRTGEACGP